MLIYLDMCCLKRPFDDQSQPRIRLESEAVLGLVAVESANCRFVRSPALLLENSHNPVKERAARVNEWLTAGPALMPDLNLLQTRTADLIRLGFKNFDALHAASAEQARADVLVSCDDRFLSAGVRHARILKVRFVGILDLAKELLL